MPTATELVLAGYTGYAGWGDAEANADFNATQGAGKGNGSFGGGGGSVPTFNFDYAAEATKAYGEMGPYYLRLLTEAKGDMNKILTRLTEDYDRGMRIKKEDTTDALRDVGEADAQAAIAERAAKTNLVDNALSRGLYQKSLNDPSTDPESGFGIPDVNFLKTNENFNFQEAQRNQQRTAINTGLNRFTEEVGINKARTTEDTLENQKRREFQLEEERKLRSADVAETRGARAYQDYINKFSLA